MGDTIVSGENTVLTGKWSVARRYPGVTNPAITISSSLLDGRAMAPYDVQLPDAGSLLLQGALGGSCPGSPNDGRNAAFTYTRR